MGRTYDAIDDQIATWISRQPLFFVGTAPLAPDGHVNVSPKGPIGTLRVLSPDRIAYLDIVGSGAETIAHVRQNGRVVVMLCAFDGPPRILRLHGTATVHLPGEARFDELLAEASFDEPTVPEARRAIVEVAVERVSSSCGYGVPLMSYEGQRPHTHAWATKRLRADGPDGLAIYRDRHNRVSVDGLPAVPGPASGGSPAPPGPAVPPALSLDPG